jgi:aminomethyltransferase
MHCPGRPLWDDDSPPGHSRQFVAHDRLLVIVAAPAGPTAVDRQYRPSELRLLVTRANPSPLLVPALPEPLGEVLDEFTLRAGTAHSYTVAKGQYVQVLDVAGRQCSDFVALDRRALDRGVELDLDQTVTRTLNGSAYPAPGCSRSFSTARCNRCWRWCRTPSAATTPSPWPARRATTKPWLFRARQLQRQPQPRTRAHGVQARNGWPAINFFFNTGIDAHQQMTLDEPWSRPGDYVLLRAMTDLVCGSTSCPDDIDPANGWNPTDIHVRIYSEKERFSIAMSTRTTADADPILTRETAFHSRTSALTGSFIDYRNWWLPLRYDGYGATEEYLGCRERVAVMDLTALRKFEIIGPDAEALLQYCLTRDVRRLAVGQVVYSAMCHEHGGMLDDGTLLRLGPDNFRWICGEDYAGCGCASRRKNSA